MSKKTLKFIDFEVDKKEFHRSKQLIDLNLVDIDNIVVSDKFRHSDNGSKYFIGYKEDNIIRPLCIILPQMSGYIKYFNDVGKNMSFKIETDNVFLEYNEIWNKIKRTLGIRFHSQVIYDEKYIKAKVKTFNGVINAVFSDNKIPKEGIHYTRIAAICIDSVMKIDKKTILKFI